MSKPDHPFHLRVTLPVLSFVVVACGILLSFYTHDPHWLNRAGALLAALAAAAILLQIRAEISLEEERSELEAKAEGMRDADGASPLDDLEVRLVVKRLEVQRNKIAQRRLNVAARVIGVAMLGELLHGFGDLLMCNAFGVCALH